MVSLLVACSGGSFDAVQPPIVAETGCTTETGHTMPPEGVTGLSWRLHAEVGSLVYASWSQGLPATVHVEYSVDPDVWLSSPSRTLEAGEHEQLLVGIPYGEDAEWRVVVEGGQVVDGDPITTAPVPEGLPVPRVIDADPSRWLPEGRWLLTSMNSRSGGWVSGDYWTFILDRQGRVVWAHPTPLGHWTLFAQVSVTGDHILWDQQTKWSDFDQGEGSTVHKTWLDEEFEVVPTPGLHHEFVQLPDGTLTWGSDFHAGYEALVEKAPGQPDETVIWTCLDDWPGSGPCESNGLYYRVSTDSYLYSFYTNSSVVEVARTSGYPDATPGESRWWAGQVEGGYRFDPPESAFFWQHGLSYTDAGTLLLSSELQGTTWLLEYEVDPGQEALHFVWGSDSEVTADTNGQAWRLGNGNTLHIVGSAGVIREVTPDDVDVWRLTYDADNLLGHGQFIEDLYALVKPTE